MQGSGKTLTMIVAAHLLRRQPELDNPTILIVVDRLELEAQMLQNLEAFGLPAIRAESRTHLAKPLATDTRGVTITTIHKFYSIHKHILTRCNVIVLVDEAHRLQERNLTSTHWLRTGRTGCKRKSNAYKSTPCARSGVPSPPPAC